MLRLFLIVLICLLGWLAQAGHPLSLEDLKKYALANNLGLQSLKAEVEAIRASGRVKRSVYFPQISLVGGPEVLSQENRSESDTFGYLGGEWNLFRGSQDRIEVEISDYSLKLAETNRDRLSFEVELDVENLFYLFLFKSKKLEFYEKSLGINQKHKQLIQQKKASGMASMADVMEFDIREANLNSEMSSLKQEREEAKLGLLRLLGPALDRDFEPQGELPHLHVTKSVQDFLGDINATSPAVKMASYASAMSSLYVKQNKFSWLPTIDMEWKYGKLPLALAASYPAFNGVVWLKWNIFSGFATSARITEAEAQSRKTEFEFKQRLLSVMTEAEIEYSKLESIQERVHAEEGNEKRAEKYYQAVLEEYRRGIKNGADLRAAEELWLLARVRQSDLRYQYIDKLLKVQKSLGLKIDVQLQEEKL